MAAQSVKLIVRIRPSLLAVFRRRARADRRTLSDWVRLTLERASSERGALDDAESSAGRPAGGRRSDAG